MSLEIIQGDLFDPRHGFEAMAQGVNCQGIMGAGIAVPFRDNYPEMYEEYKKLCKEFGAILPGLIHLWEPKPKTDVQAGEDGVPTLIIDFGMSIYNLFTQIQPGKNADYSLLQKSALLMRMNAEASGHEKVGLPWIGCGIGGLEKHNVEHLLHQILDDSHVNFVIVEQ